MLKAQSPKPKTNLIIREERMKELLKSKAPMGAFIFSWMPSIKNN
jgi:hypothetical protein